MRRDLKHLLPMTVKQVPLAEPFYSIELNFFISKLLTFSSIEKHHHQTEDLHEGRHFMRDWWEISLLLTDPLYDVLRWKISLPLTNPP